MKLEEMNRDERSLLLFLESCTVDQGGRVDSRRMNKEDFDLAKKWADSGFVEFGRVVHADIFRSLSHWCQLSEEAWKLAHEERIARSKRLWEKRNWKKTRED